MDQQQRRVQDRVPLLGEGHALRLAHGGRDARRLQGGRRPGGRRRCRGRRRGRAAAEVFARRHVRDRLRGLQERSAGGVLPGLRSHGHDDGNDPEPDVPAVIFFFLLRFHSQELQVFHYLVKEYIYFY